MAKPKIRDVVIVLPGIIGSVLQKDGKDLWALSGSALWNTLKSMGGWLQNLHLEDPDVDDGVLATRLLDDVHIIPGLVKIDGYSGITGLIQREFEVIAGILNSDAPANFFEFPYDWRRDNRRTARQFETFAQDRLRRWREATNNPDARLILLAHSMGGLVSRYFCEVLGGWRDTRALVTFGTPHRGSPNALDFLVNGYKKMFVDLGGPLRSMPSAYQLLPIYEMVSSDAGPKRPAELTWEQLNDELVRDGLAFHREIESAVDTNRKEDSYHREYTTLPFVGTRQPTLQSASLSEARLQVSRNVPKGVDALLQDGDGTVPRLSAIPIELSTEYRDTFLAERHSNLHNNRAVLQDIRERIVHMQTRGLSAIRGPEPKGPERAELTVDVDDVYEPDEQVIIEAAAGGDEIDRLVVSARQVDGNAAVLEELEVAGASGQVDLTGLPPGVYRLEVSAKQHGPGAPTPVHDVFVVAG